MVGVQSYEECPQCGYKYAEYEFQTRDGTEWLMCPRCGYCVWTELVLKDGIPVLDENGRWKYRKHEQKGFGAFAVEHENGVISVGSFKIPLPDEKIEEFIQLSKERNFKILFINLVKEGRIETVYGEFPSKLRVE